MDEMPTNDRPWVLIIVALSVVLQACPSDDGESDGEIGAPACPERLRDTLGFEYGYDCDGFELSTVVESPTPPMCSSPDVAVFRLRPGPNMPRICYFQAEPGATSGTTSADACRPLACTSRGDCPGGYPCVRGICRIDPLPLSEETVFALCFADIPWPQMCSFDAFHPDFADRLEPIIEACPDDGDSCTLPAECPE
jgi:hypothetical protein